jgi:hypothetical protein
MAPKTMTYVYKLGNEVYEYEDPSREPELQPLGCTLTQNGLEYHDQNCKRNEAGQNIEVHDEGLALT